LTNIKNNVFIQSGGGRRPFEATATNISCSKKEMVGANSCPVVKLARGQMGTVLRYAVNHSIHKALS